MIKWHYTHDTHELIVFCQDCDKSCNAGCDIERAELLFFDKENRTKVFLCESCFYNRVIETMLKNKDVLDLIEMSDEEIERHIEGGMKKYDFVGELHEGRARVGLNGKYGFINADGVEITPPKYDDAWSFREGRAHVLLNGKWGFIDADGVEIIPFKYDGAWGFSGGRARVRINGKWGYINEDGVETWD